AASPRGTPGEAAGRLSSGTLTSDPPLLQESPVDLQLAGQVAVVAGGARGIGRAIAEAFATEGAHVVLIDRDPAVTAAAEEVAARRPVRALPLAGDVTDYAAVQRLAGEALSGLGRVDHVVYAVAVGSGKYGF